MYRVKQFMSKVGDVFFPTYERDVDDAATVQAGGTGICESACDGCCEDCEDRKPDDTRALVRLEGEGLLIRLDGDSVVIGTVGKENTIALRMALEFAVQALKDAEAGESEVWYGHNSAENDSDEDDPDEDDPDKTDVDSDAEDQYDPYEALLKAVLRCLDCDKEDPTHGYAD